MFLAWVQPRRALNPFTEVQSTLSIAERHNRLRFRNVSKGIQCDKDFQWALSGAKDYCAFQQLHASQTCANWEEAWVQ